jgi:hypothetical protein
VVAVNAGGYVKRGGDAVRGSCIVRPLDERYYRVPAFVKESRAKVWYPKQPISIEGLSAPER